MTLCKITLLSMAAMLASMTVEAGENRNYESRWDRNIGPHLMSAQPFEVGEKEHRFFFKGELLIWDTYLSDTDYALGGEDPGSDFTSTDVGGSVHSVDFDWDVGVRGTIGITPDWDGWDLRGVLTHFCTVGNDRVEGGTNGANDLMWPLFWHPALDSQEEAGGAKSRIEVEYNTYDILVGRPSFVSESVAVHPFFGARVLCLDQSHVIQYFGDEFSTEDSEAAARMHFDSDYTGGGLHAGTALQWHLGNGLTLFGKCGGSLLVGCSRIRHRMTLDSTSSSSGTPSSMPVDLNNRQTEVRPGVEGQIGLLWEKNRDGAIDHLMVYAAYEVSHWFNVNKPRRFYGDAEEGSTSVSGAILGASSSSDGGHLGFHGVTAGARIGF